jgi:hypothetical protein
MPRRATRELSLLDQHQVVVTEPGQVVGHAGADHPTADDHDLSLGRYVLRAGLHQSLPPASSSKRFRSGPRKVATARSYFSIPQLQ